MTTQEKILAAWASARDLHDAGYSGVSLEVSLSQSKPPEICLDAQASTEDEAQGAADLLHLTFRREFDSGLPWFRYTAAAPFGAVKIYAVRHVPGCEISVETETLEKPETRRKYVASCPGGPATLVPVEA